MKSAGIPRKSTVSWNLIPGWNGTRKVTTIELRDGMGRLRELISLLPRLRAVVLVGQKAAKAQSFLEQSRPELVVLISSHPSPLVKAKYPRRWHAIPAEWAKVLPYVTVRES
jgi:uracil-DNA glycosylase